MTLPLESTACFQPRLESGQAAGPWMTCPARLNIEPWHGHSNRCLSLTRLTEHPRWEQLMAKTFSLPASSLTAKPANAILPAALSPPPFVIRKPVSEGAVNLTPSPLPTSGRGLSSLIGTSWRLVLPPGGQMYTRIGMTPATTVAVSRPARYQTMKLRRVTGRLTASVSERGWASLAMA